MNQKREDKTYTKAFKEEAVALVTDRANLLYGWKQPFEDNQSGSVLSGDEHSDLVKLRKENKQLRMEK